MTADPSDFSNPLVPDDLDSLAAQAASPHDPVINKATKAKAEEKLGSVTSEKTAANRPMSRRTSAKSTA